MTPEEESKLLRHLSNIDTVLAARNINAASQARDNLARLDKINDNLAAIRNALYELEVKK